MKPKEVAIAVGHELRLARLDLNWTRQQAVDRVPGMTSKCLDNNESGTRMCNLVTLVQLCRSMAVHAPHLLELAMQRMPISLDRITLHVDLSAVTKDPYPPRSLRGWATELWHRGSHHHGVVRVPPHTIAWIARSTNIQPRFLINYLASKGPHSIRGSRTLTIRTQPNPDPPSDTGLTKQTFGQALGIELRTLRQDRNWTNADITFQFARPISASSWYAYELGAAQCNIARLIELGQIFNVTAPVLLNRTLGRLGLATPDAGGIDGERLTTRQAPDRSTGEVVEAGLSSVHASSDQP